MLTGVDIPQDLQNPKLEQLVQTLRQLEPADLHQLDRLIEFHAQEAQRYRELKALLELFVGQETQRMRAAAAPLDLNYERQRLQEELAHTPPQLPPAAEPEPEPESAPEPVAEHEAEPTEDPPATSPPVEELAVRIDDILAEHGGCSPAFLAEQLRMTPHKLSRFVNRHPWFVRDKRGRIQRATYSSNGNAKNS